MESTSSSDWRSKKSPALVPQLPRYSRGSLEVFNPSDYSSRTDTPAFQPQQPTWQSWFEPKRSGSPEHVHVPVQLLPPLSTKGDGIPSWMALKDPEATTVVPPAVSRDEANKGEGEDAEAGAAAQRAAEWGLVLKTDDETGKPRGVTVRTSGGDERRGMSTSRNSSSSLRDSRDISEREGKERGLPRVSEELKDALSTFQQTFVVSDATKPDHPIMYASAGFFKMTGYTSKEVIGRNCRFLQGSETDPDDVSRIREALHEGKSYCGRLVNYKKDGTPFWNLLTIAPIKDDSGSILKFIGMQVEVSKHTEGSKEKMMRPNGLPESLIRYDGIYMD